MTLGYIVNFTGGSLYHYNKFNPLLDGEKLHYDLSRNLTRYTGVDAVMTVRSRYLLIFICKANEDSSNGL